MKKIQKLLRNILVIILVCSMIPTYSMSTLADDSPAVPGIELDSVYSEEETGEVLTLSEDDPEETSLSEEQTSEEAETEALLAEDQADGPSQNEPANTAGNPEETAASEETTAAAEEADLQPAASEENTQAAETIAASKETAETETAESEKKKDAGEETSPEDITLSEEIEILKSDNITKEKITVEISGVPAGEDLELEVKEASETTYQEIILDEINKDTNKEETFEALLALDISVGKGQLDQPVTVTITADRLKDLLDEDILYHINKDNKAENIKYKYKEDKDKKEYSITFETDAFSPFVIGTVSEESMMLMEAVEKASGYVNNTNSNWKWIVEENEEDRIVLRFEYVGSDETPSNFTIPSGMSSTVGTYRNLIQEIVLPDEVTLIAGSTFQQMTALEKVNIPKNVTEVRGSAFSGCTSLSTVEFAQDGTANLTIGANAFQNCAITGVTIPGRTTSIGSYAFSGNRSLSDLTFAEGTGNLTIGANAFQNNAITSLTIPARVTSIGNYAFDGNSSLAALTLEDGEKALTIGTYVFRNTLIESLTIPARVTSIGSYAFAGNSNLSTLAFTDGDKNLTINSNAFENSTVENLTLPDRLYSLGSNAFANNKALKTLSMPSINVISSLGSNIFLNDTTLEDVVFRSVERSNVQNYSSLSSGMFSGCTAIKKMDLSGIETGTYRTFTYNLTSSTLPNLEELTLPGDEYGTNLTIDYMQNDRSITALDSMIKNPEQIASMSSNLYRNTGITSADMSSFDVLNYIGEKAFADNDLLTTAVIPEKVTNIGSQAFANDPLLKTFTLRANNLTTVGYSKNRANIFDGSGALETVTIGKEVNNLTGNFLAAVPSSAKVIFEGPSELTISKATLAGTGVSPLKDLDGKYYADSQGVLYRLKDDGTAALAYVPDGITEYTVPETITLTDEETTYTVDRVDPNAVKLAESLTKLNITKPENVELAPSAFTGWSTSADNNGKTINGQTKLDPSDWKEVSTLCDFPVKDSKAKLVPVIENPFKNADGKEVLKTIIAVNDKTVDEDGTYKYKTGQPAKYTIAINNPDNVVSENIVRVYFMYDKDKYELGALTVGEYTLVGEKGSYPVKVVETDTPGVYYYEISGIVPGDTLAFQNDVLYPNPGSPGGTLKIWTTTISSETAEALQGRIINPNDYIQIEWTTTPVERTLKKANTTDHIYLNGSSVQKNPELSVNDAGEILLKHLAYAISEHVNSEQASSENAGKDHILWVQYEDILELPDYFHWRDGLIEAIKAGNWRVTTVSAYEPGGNYSYTHSVIYVTVGGVEYPLTYIYPTVTDLKPVIVNEEGTETVKLTWRGLNDSTQQGDSVANEYSTKTYKVRFGDTVLLADDEGISEVMNAVDEDGNPAPGKLMINNIANETRHYSYSDDQSATASVEREVTVAAELQIAKTWQNTDTLYMGLPGYSTITLNNTGGLAINTWGTKSNNVYNGNIISDSIDRYFYITEDDLFTMLHATAQAGSETANLGDWLTITINNVYLFNKVDCQPSEGPINQVNKYTSSISASADVNARVKGSAKMVLKGAEGGAISLELTGDPDNDGTYTFADAAALKDFFDNIGYMPTSGTTYSLNYIVDEHGFTLRPGCKLQVPILATAKTTPMLLSVDSESYYPTNSSYYNEYYHYRSNSATVRAKVGDTDFNQSANTGTRYIYNELNIYKSGYIEGSSSAFSGGGNTVTDGTVIDNRIYAQNLNGIPYDKMFMGDYMSGSQVLMVPVAENPTLTAPDGTILEKQTAADGKEYWLLNVVGTYENVKLGSTTRNGEAAYIADSITVTESRDSTHRTQLYTVIKWQWFEDWGATSDYTNIYYKSIFSAQKAGTLVTPITHNTYYSVSNRAWLGDHQGHRLYDTLTAGYYYRFYGSPVKRILKDDGTLATYSRLTAKEEGEKVTYQITFSNTGNIENDLSGSNIYDELPNTYKTFAWEKGVNVTNLRYKTDSEGVYITAGSGDAKANLNTNGEPNPDHEDYWYIQNVNTTNGTYRIRWNSDFIIHLPAKATINILVDVIFPARPEEGASVWDQYVAENRGRTLYNTFYLYSYSSSVSHSLEAEGKAVLYKGVYDTGITGKPVNPNPSYPNSIISYSSNQTRFMYMNGDKTPSATDSNLKASTVTYYTVLYNGSYDRLYLSDMQDQLPRGFKFQGLTNYRYSASPYSSSGSYGSYLGYQNPVNTLYSTEYYGGSSQYATINKSSDSYDKNSVSYINTQIEASIANGDDGRQHITFKVTGKAHYDSEVGKYYLNPGEALRFGYNVLVGELADTDDLATNTITMPYFDYYDVGLTLDVPTEEHGGAVPVVSAITDVQANDGSCELMSAQEVADKYGVDTSAYTEDTRYNNIQGGNWLVSSVSVERSPITPGLQKSVGGTTTKSTSNSETRDEGTLGTEGAMYGTAYSGGAKTTDVINWRLRIFNEAKVYEDQPAGNRNVSGTMYDYSLTDTMAYPYGFTGQVFYNLYKSNGTRMTSSSQPLFKLGTRKQNDTSVLISDENKSLSTSQSLAIGSAEDDSDDTWFNFGTGNKSGSVKIERNAEGKEIITIKFTGTGYAIPGGYYIDVCIHTMYTIEGDRVISEGKYNDSVLKTSPYQDYDRTRVVHGRTLTEQQFDDKGNMSVVNAGIQSGASIMLTMGYTTESWKKVYEIGNESNKATSNDSITYITLSEKTKSFHYDLYMVGPQTKMNKLVMIDTLPYEGDHSAFVMEDKRNSEYKVGFNPEDPGFFMSIAPKKNGTEQTIAEDRYTIWLSEKEELDAEDWNGEGTGWVNYNELSAEEKVTWLKKARSVRFIIEDENAWQNDASKWLMGNQCQVHYGFNALVADTKAEAGQIAWNSFGYRYWVPLNAMTHTALPLEAQPLNVGVKFPSAPVLTKKLTEIADVEEDVIDPETGEKTGETVTVQKEVDHAAKMDLQYGFIIYEGDKLTDLDDALNMKLSEIVQTLTDNDRNFIYVPLTVKEGASQESFNLWTIDYTSKYDAANDSFEDNEEVLWHWYNAARYTILELPMGDYNYELNNIKIGASEANENNRSFDNTNMTKILIDANNRYLPEYKNISGHKVWDDVNDLDQLRPEYIHVHLFADGEEIASGKAYEDKFVLDSEEEPEDPKQGNSETGDGTEGSGDAGQGSEGTDNGDGTEGSDSGSDDGTGDSTGDGTDGSGSSSDDGTGTGDGQGVGTGTGTEDQAEPAEDHEAWSWHFEHLLTEHEDGKLIVYTVEEDPVKGYKTSIEADENDPYTFTITNSHTPDLGDLRITKTLENKEKMSGRMDPVTFIFSVEATRFGKVVYSDVVSMVFTEAGTQEIVIENLPDRAEVVVKEVYAGGNYTVIGSDTAQTKIIMDDPETEEYEMAEAAFTNTYDTTWHGGGSVANNIGADGTLSTDPSYARESSK